MTEEPLNGSARAVLYVRAGVVVLMAYLFSVLAVLLLCGLLSIELIFVLILLRFGLAGFMITIMERHLAVLRQFLRSFWLQKAEEYRVTLERAEAPGLFEQIQSLCQRAQVAVPNEVAVELTVNAWIQLKGLLPGVGRSTLGLGYDLLAGLTQAELVAVLAHEFMHAKLVQRGYKRWLNGGLARSAQLASHLAADLEFARQTKRSHDLIEPCFRIADRLTRSTARLVAACSRQDEFDADRGAAQLCGTGPLRSALLKLEGLNECAARLPLNERFARLASGHGYSEWLVGELAAAKTSAPSEAARRATSSYSTHPSLRDRLAALPVDRSPVGPDDPSAIAWLARPDQLAGQLMAQIHRALAEQEEKDSRRLKRWARKSAGQVHLRTLQLVGLAFILTGIGVVLYMLFGQGFDWGTTLLAGAALVLGGLGFHFGRYRPKVALPVPDFAVIKAAWQNPVGFSSERAKQVETEMRARNDYGTSAKAHALACVTEGFRALERCDYGHAYVAARLALEMKKDSPEAALVLLVATAGLGQSQQVFEILRFLQHRTGMRPGTVAWGAAWSLILVQDWATAEAFLNQAVDSMPEQPTLLLLIALCRSQRGKLQSAIAGARKVCTPKARHKEHQKFLIGLLLDGGYSREAHMRLLTLPTELKTDPELMLSMARWNLLQRDFVSAEEWTKLLRTSGTVSLQLRLAGLWEEARQFAPAEALFREILATGHFPEAHLGLSRLEAARKDPGAARRHAHLALNLVYPLADRAVGPLPLFHRILGQLLALEEPTADCQAWIARFGRQVTPEALAETALLVYGQDIDQAVLAVEALVGAMRPGMPPLLPDAITWTEAPRQRQPVGLVRPGVQGVYV